MSLARKNSRGFTLLEVMVSLVIVAGAMAGLTIVAQGYSESAQRALVAQQVRTLGDAAKSYIKDNYAAIQAVATPTGPALIEIPTLIAGGQLTTGFAVTNGFNQSMCVLVLEPTANRLQAMVVSENGTTIDNLSLGEMAATIGGPGGGVYSDAATIIKGSLGGWQIPVSTFDNLTNNVNRRCDGTAGRVRVAAGRPAMALWFENGDTASPSLSRTEVPGRPELNEMTAPLVMNSIQTVSSACTQVGAIARDSTGAMVSCQGGQWRSPGGSTFWADPVANLASLPTCNAAALGQARLVRSPAVGSGPRAYSCNGSAWVALAVDDQGALVVPRRITGGGADATHGAITIQGEQNGWSGVNFKLANGTNAGTLMMHPTYGGFYNSAQNNWRWYTDDAGATWQNSSANVSDVYVRASGHWLSSVTSCPSGYFWSGGYCQHVSWYAAGVPAGYGVISRTGGCPGGYYPYQYMYALDSSANYSSLVPICYKL